MSPHPGLSLDISRVYMLSDFPVAPTDYSRLSKLVLYASLSKESKLIAERVAKRRIKQVLTTAYSNAPESMKYRGIFKLHTRKENLTTKRDWGETIDVEANAYYRRKYELNYLAEWVSGI
jgi:hypothetical protein